MPDKLVLIADEDTVLGFGALGMECFVAEDRGRALSAMEKIMNASSPARKDSTGMAVVFVTDEVAGFLSEELESLMKKLLIMSIPSCRSRNKMGLKELTAIVEKAVGIADIMDKA